MRNDSQQSTEENLHRETDLTEQLELEKWCSRTGGYRATTGKWQAGAAGFLGQQFTEGYLRLVLDQAAVCKQRAGIHGSAFRVFDSQTGLIQVALDALFFVLNESGEEVKRNRIAAVIGKRAEFILFLESPEWGNSAHLKGLRLANGADLSMGMIRRRLLDKGFKKALAYKPLTTVERIAVGTLMLTLIESATGLIVTRKKVVDPRRGRVAYVIQRTDAFWKFLDRWKDNLLVFRPVWMPMLTPPKPWEALTGGGYHTILTQVSSVPWERWAHFMKDAKPCVLGSLNLLQAQAMSADWELIHVQKECWRQSISIGALPPRDRMEKPIDAEFKREGRGPSAFWQANWEWRADRRKNTDRAKFIHCMSAWDKLSNADQIYFVWHTDYRGRMYQRGSQINFMGSDVFRSQLRFSGASSPITGNETEFAWAMGDAWGLAKDVAVRKKHMAEHMDWAIEAGRSPLDRTGYWSMAKDPWRYLQLCMDLHGHATDPNFETSSVFMLDQTTSGYGHAACLMRDQWLAEATNVIGTSHNDLYEEVGACAMVLINSIGGSTEKEQKLRTWWANHGVPRDLTKRLVMPVIYRRSHLTMIDAINEYLRDEVENFLVDGELRIVDLSKFLAAQIHIAVKELMPSIGGLHAWLTKVARAQIKAGFRPYWVTPNGMVVESYSSESYDQTYFLNMTGRRVRIRCKDTEGSPPSLKKSMGQLSADFIHSQDAAFLQRFVWHWRTYGHPIISIHDCVGTTLDNVSLMRGELQDQFARFYSEDHLTRMKETVEEGIKVKLPPPPIVGTLDLQDIGENPYLFT